ncbi:class II fructose-bisphosphate aldolase [Kitasatospora indigofera]|uniref:class II fructose-bisphosphate aldolase n=1 Tax=Kitasatospora indigofera TaxID=67307 RepID=UPI00364FFDF8
MTLVPTAELVSRAATARTGVAAFNVLTLEHARAVAAAAEHTGLPAIIAVSENAVRYQRALAPLSAACAAIARASGADLALHLDHVEDFALVEQAAAHGYGSVMFDASRLPHGENVLATGRAARLLHAQGLWLEAELGEIGGKDGVHAPTVRTDPADAAAYAAATGVDALAVAVGSSHAMTEQSARLDHALIAAIHAAVPVPLVLHGSSGVADPELRRAVAAGMTKINIGTQLNVAFTGAVRAPLDAALPVDPRRWLGPAHDAVAETATRLLTVIAAPAAVAESAGRPRT